MDCPDHEHWSVTLNRCDYPGIAKCRPNGTHQFKIKKTKPLMASEQVDDEEKPAVGDFEIDPRCEGSDPFKPLQLKHTSDCTKFFKCYMGKAYVIKCPKGQHWAQHMNRCEHASVAHCTLTRPSIRPAQADYSVEEDEEEEYEDEHTIIDDPDYKKFDSRCIPDEPDIYHPIQFAHPTDCSMFYKCFDHVAYKSQCPFGLYYNERDEMCDYPFNTQCNQISPAGFVQADMNVPSVPDCPKGKKQNMPVEGMANAYFSCVDGLAYLMECERGELYNSKSSKCEKYSMPSYPNYQYPGMWGQMPQYPQYPQQPQIPMAPQQPQQPPQYPQQPPVSRPTRPALPNPDFPSWMPIPNPNVPMPNFPSKPQAPTDGSSKVDFNYQNGKPNSRCPSADEPLKPTHLSHETDCNKFYKCFNGRAFVMECPGSQEWSDELQRCDYHQFANCDPIELIKKKIQN
jgi:Chitin binding Peritrophin-A domain